jgi:hypothetical protein
MFFTKEVDTFCSRLDSYKTCFSKPQWSHFKTYLTGLMLGEKGEKNIQDIAGNLLNGGHQSSLNRFITKHRWNPRQVNAIRLRECLHDRTGGILSLDDTLIEKTGKEMDGVGYLYDTVQKKNILCHDIVSTFYRSSTEQLPLYFEPYVKKEIADTTGLWFRTKIQIALDLLRQSLAQVTPSAIVFDEWYMSQEITEFINNRGLTWVSQAKTNRCIQIGEAWIGLATYARTLPAKAFIRVNTEVDEKRFKWFYETTVVMKKVGVVKLVVLKQRKNSKKHTFLVSNTTSLSGMKILEYYKKRWAIEVFHRDCKQHLGLGEYQIRKLDCCSYTPTPCFLGVYPPKKCPQQSCACGDRGRHEEYWCCLPTVETMGV